MIAGRYSREREIGRGGMGAVWLGRDEVLGRPVAIKRVGAGGGQGEPDLARAEREAKIAASLNHPHIVGVFDLVSEDEHQWMVMEYVEGSTLSDLVRTRGVLAPDEAAAIIAQAASALSAAHARGIVHRDVKPSNILVREDGHVKLTDFGIARSQTDASLTMTGLVTGSPPYLAPEVASGAQATAASDVWSLGATLFHALAGHPPYDASDNVLGALYRIVHEPPPRVDDAGWLGPLLTATMNHAIEQRWTMPDIERFLDRSDDSAGPGPTPPAPIAGLDSPTQALPVAAVGDGLATAALAPTVASAGTASDLGPSDSAPPAPPLPPTPPPTSRPQAAAPEGDPRDEQDGRRRVLPVVIVALVALLVTAVAFLALQGDPQENLAADPGSSPAATPTPSPEPSATPTSETPDVPTKAAMRDFVTSYLDLASRDPQSAFQQLTPAFQRASTEYEQFWGRVNNPQLVSFNADPAELTVSYTYRYQFRGVGTRVDPERLQLVATDDGFLIAGSLL